MDQSSDNGPSTASRSGPTGLLAAIACAALLIGVFAMVTAQTTMPAAERWAALTTFALLALAYTLQGSVGVYDALGRVVRRDNRALAALLAFIPVLYVSYSATVGEFAWSGLLTALVFVALPAVAFVRSRGRRALGLLDLVAILYLWVSVEFNLTPMVQLPQQGGLVGFFRFSAVPLLLLLLAARGWPGLGFSWFLSGAELWTTLLAALVTLIAVAPLALAFGIAQSTATVPAAVDLFTRAVQIYFFVALPQEILFRGVVQNGIERLLETRQRKTRSFTATRTPASTLLRSSRGISLGAAALIFGATHMVTQPMDWRFPLLAILASLAYGWVYQQTGKVTAAAVVHLLVDWCWSIFFAGG